jgi:SNF2 family DNA or RNA helicase
MKTSTKTIQNKSKQTPIKNTMSSTATATVMGSTATATSFQRWVSSVNWKQEDHQVKGYEWCVKRENLTPQQRQQQTPYGGIIADEMGLGKTTLILALMQLNNDIPILNAGMPTTTSKKTLIVLPSMLIQQWNSIIKSKLNIDPYIFHGNDAKYRVRVSKNELGNKESKREKMNLKILKEIINTQSVVITTYGMISDRNANPSKSRKPSNSRNARKPNKPYHCVLWDYHWDRIVFDEAHNMRNRNTRVFHGAMRLGNKTTTRWLVTGTPIQNRVSDLGSLSIILNTPEVVHGNSSEKRIKAFETKYILRRHKTDIDTVLPKLNVNCVSVEWSNENEKRVSDVLHSNLSFAPVTEANVDEIMRYLGNREYFAMLTRCRQVCILPSLAQPGFSPPPLNHLLIPNQELALNLARDFIQSPIFNTESSKMNALMAKITENKDNNHDKLIFCHYRGEMDTLSRRIRAETNLRVSTIRGGMTAKARAAALSQNVNGNALYDALSPLFKKLTSNFPERLCDHILSYIKNDVLIMQIKSGSDGLNLQQYSEVYFTSPHWNPSVEDQALARVHRIGQKKDVTVYKFIMNRVNGNNPSFDAYCNAVQNMKRKVQKEYNLLASSTTQIKEPYYEHNNIRFI